MQIQIDTRKSIFQKMTDKRQNIHIIILIGEGKTFNVFENSLVIEQSFDKIRIESNFSKFHNKLKY